MAAIRLRPDPGSTAEHREDVADVVSRRPKWRQSGCAIAAPRRNMEPKMSAETEEHRLPETAGEVGNAHAELDGTAPYF